jgi:hypothetical protein
VRDDDNTVNDISIGTAAWTRPASGVFRMIASWNTVSMNILCKTEIDTNQLGSDLNYNFKVDYISQNTDIFTLRLSYPYVGHRLSPRKKN